MLVGTLSKFMHKHTFICVSPIQIPNHFPHSIYYDSILYMFDHGQHNAPSKVNPLKVVMVGEECFVRSRRKHARVVIALLRPGRRFCRWRWRLLRPREQQMALAQVLHGEGDVLQRHLCVDHQVAALTLHTHTHTHTHSG